MKKELRKSLIKQFTSELERTLEGYQLFGGKSAYLFGGEKAFSKNKTRKFREWIVLCPDPKGMRDAFTIEIGWSCLNRFPELSMRPSFFTPQEALENGESEYIGRLSTFWSKIDPWWEIKTEKAIKAQVDDALQKIEEHWLEFTNSDSYNKALRENFEQLRSPKSSS